MSSSVSSPPPRLISDELWALVEPLIPPRPPAIHGRTGRPRTSDRDVLEGIAFVLSTGIGWAKLPTELGYGSGWTCWRRMHEWAEAGVFDRLHTAVLDRLGETGRLDWSRASLDSVSVRAKGGELTGPHPTDRGMAGSKYHLLVDAHGLPLNVLVSGANRHDSMLVEPLLDTMPAIKRGGRGHPRRRPVKLHGDKGYDNPRVRRYLRRRGITARMARLGRDSSARLGRHRWVVERTLGWLLSYQRLALRYDRSAATINALARLAVTLICARRLPTN
ncbi:IS5 family transposase [Geodermatophilus saharensis]|uniref:IS5 family transposase n=1 Tax=Geodermatophilus saharensis TaxID=1137994 RepID=UPI000B792A96|nr:IS5 family transposase [Geodermatophilus saharensis]